ncbi:hypothetical protein [Nitrosomonas europaea]|uniref:hypothetical protein n=1 Tax=Nitrosomonas europaea TaxID=915 RepID=UPI0030B909A9
MRAHTYRITETCSRGPASIQRRSTAWPTIRASSDALRADNAVGLAHFNTEGSSGELSIFFIGTKRVSHDVAAKWHATR